MDILSLIIDEDKDKYKCYDILKYLISTNEEFADIVAKGLSEGKITKFSAELWDKIRNQNIRRINSFEDVFVEGANLGYCTVASKQLSYSLDNCFICGGTLPILRNTPNCIDGSHTWISSNGQVIDTTLMLMIDENYSKQMGYKEENRYNPNLDPLYVAAKEWTNDSSLKASGDIKR